MSGTDIESYDIVWDAIANTPVQAANPHTRAELLRQIAAIVKSNGWAPAARYCGVTKPRMKGLLRGRVSRFSLDVGVNHVHWPKGSNRGKRLQLRG